MNTVQRIIKYMSMGFAIFLIVGILSGIMSCFMFFGNIFDKSNDNEERLNDLKIVDNISVLDIDVSNVNIVIETGNVLLAKTNNKDIKIEQSREKLYITQTKSNWLKNKNEKLFIYVPQNLVFDKVSIDTGAGSVVINNLTTKNLYFELGAGKVNIDNLVVSNKAEIEGGAGSLKIINSNLNNLDLDMGIGSLSISSFISGKSDIEAGVGPIDVTLLGSINDYKINVEKALGNFTIDGEKVKDDTSYGNGNSIIDIDGAVGSIEVKFIN